MPKSKIPHPREALYFRHVQAGVKQRLVMLATALGRTQEEIANTALKIGIAALERKIASGELDTE